VRRRRLLRRAANLALLVLLGVLVALETGRPWAGALLLPVAAAYALLANRIDDASARRLARALIEEDPARHPEGRRRLVLEGNSIRVETPSSTSTVRLDGPVRVEERGGFAHLEIGNGEAMFLPLRPVERGDPRAFVEAVRARAAAGAAAQRN
jgi:predicted LPLAT superfamily acyltransferase